MLLLLHTLDAGSHTSHLLWVLLVLCATSLKDGDNVYGNHVRVKVVKNKVAPPFRKAEFDILFGQGINKAGEILDLGVENDIVGKSGSWFSYNGSKLGQGRDAAVQLLKDNPELCEEIEKQIVEKIKEVE